MDVHSLARTPLFLFSLVATAVVIVYACAVTLRAIISKFSADTITNQLDPQELLALDLTNIFRSQRAKFMDRFAAAEQLFDYFPELQHDAAWGKIVLISERLTVGMEELSRRLRQGDISTAVMLARFLTSGRGFDRTSSPLADALHVDDLTGWHSKTTELLQRILAKAEDSFRHDQLPQSSAPSKECSSKLRLLRELIIEEEENMR